MKVSIRTDLIERYVEKSDVDIVYFANSFYVVKKQSKQTDGKFTTFELAEKRKEK